MKKLIIAILAIAVIGISYWLVAPFFINKEVNETEEDLSGMVPAETRQVLIAQGSFVGVDNFHKGEGTVKLIKAGDKYFIRFENDFKVTNGPDLFVHFGKNGRYSSEARIGMLKGNIGGQNYEIPGSIDPEDYDEVWIWCRVFSAPFASAILERSI